jgi:hypothetical protein
VIFDLHARTRKALGEYRVAVDAPQRRHTRKHAECVLGQLGTA